VLNGGFVVCELLVENDVQLFWSILSSYPVTEEAYKNCDKPPFVYAIRELKNIELDHLDVKCKCLPL
jgi:hypothetical protein